MSRRENSALSSNKYSDAEKDFYLEVSTEQLSADRNYDSSKEDRNKFVAFAGGIGSVALIIQFLWIGPFTRQLPVWRAARSHKKTNTKKKRIIGRDSLTPYSIADELLKWSKLREDGLITEGEYQEARMKLLNRR